MPKWKADAKKREEEQKAGAKKPQSSSVKNVNKKAQNSTFMGGGSSVKKTEKTYQAAKRPSAKARRVADEQRRRREQEQRQNQKMYGDKNGPVQRTSSRRTTSTSNLTQRTTAAQRQKMGMPTAEDLRNARESRRELGQRIKASVREASSEENKAFMQRQKSGTLTAEDKRRVAEKTAQRKAIAKNTGAAAKKGVQDSITGYRKTVTDLAEATASTDRMSYGQAAKLGIDKDKDKVEWAKLEANRKKGQKQAQEHLADLQEKQDKRQAEWDERTKNAKGLEKAWYGAVESGTGMATDTLVGALTGTGTAGSLASMAARTYGTTRGQAEKEGATKNEDRAYAVLQAAKEVGTELMFPGAGLAKKTYGNVGLSVADRVANKLTQGLTGSRADLVGAGVRLLGGTAEENAEELAGWGLDPVIKELAYGKKVRTRQAQNLLKQESDELRSNLKSAGDARSVAAYLGSDRFLADNIAQYKDAGLSDKQAREVAEKMRDYLTASLTGDTDRMGYLEDEIVTTVAGGSLKAMIKEYDVGELMDTFASTSVLTLATGLPATATTAMKGARIRENLGSDGLRALSQTAINFEDDEASLKGQAARDRLDSGKDLTSTQVFDLAKAQAEQIQKDEKRVAAMSDMADNAIRSEKLVTPKIGFKENGSVAGDEIITMNYVNESNNATEIISDLLKEEGSESLTDTEVQTGSRAIAGFKTGAFTVNDANALNYTNTTVRSAFEAATGVNLSQYVVRRNGQVDIPATNAATKDALFAMAADNFVKTAQAETANWMDSVKGDVVTQVTERMGAQGSLALQQALDDVDERDRSTYMMNANAADMMYQAARNMGTEWDNVKADARKMFPDISETKLEAMYNAGLRDRADAANGAIGQQVKMGEAMALQNEPSEPKGKVFVDTTATPKGTVVRTFSEIASNLGVDIHLVDDLKTSTGGQANGQYVNGAIYINMNSDFESNIGYIFMHEVTHHLKQYAPEQFNELENLVREKWFKYNPEQMQNEIAKKIELYKRNGQTLSEEEALEEIIADAAHEFINDANFANQVAEQNPDIAKAILNGIRNALRMLRRLFASGSIDDETHMNSLFSQLNILDEAEKLWLNAYVQASQNKAAVAIDNLQNEIYASSSTAEVDLKSKVESGVVSAGFGEEKTRYSVREEEPPKNTIKAYKVFVAFKNRPGELYPPMVASPGGMPTPVGRWVNADTGELARNKDGSLVTTKKGRVKVQEGGKGTNKGKGGSLAWRPGWHLGSYPDAKQFAIKDPETGEPRSSFPPNFVWAECEIAADNDYQLEALSYGVTEKGKFDRTQAGLPYIPKDGYYKYRTNADPNTVPWLITGAMKVNRILDDDEAREICAQFGATPMKRAGGDINLSEYGFEKGEVTPTSDEDLAKLPPAADYSDEIRNLPGYVQRDVNFDDPQIQKELAMNGQDADYYRSLYEEQRNTKYSISDGYTIQDGKARWTDERIDDLIERYGASNSDYSQAYAVLMNPRDFLHITIEDELLRKWRESAASQEEGLTYKEGQKKVWDKSYLEGRLLDDQNFPLDEAELRGQTQTPFLYIRSDKSGQRVLGHEGRHRMRALMEAGVTSVPVVIEDPDTKTSKQNVDSMVLGYQEDVYNGAGIVRVNDLVPIKESNRTELIQKFGGDAQIRFSISDADYISAVESGDMETAQRMVDEAAAEAMPNTKLTGRWFHGTENEFTEFNFSQGGKNGHADGYGIYLTNDPEVAKSYGNRMIEGYVNVERPASALTSATLTKAELHRLIKRTVDNEAETLLSEGYDSVDQAKFDTWISNYTDTYYAGNIDKAIDEVIDAITNINGNDYDIILEIMTGMGIRDYDEASKFYDVLTKETGIDGFETKWGDESEMADPNTPTIALAFRSNQIKDASPVTYDDNGNVIPLSERFDPTNNDIRYSLPTTDADGNVLTDGQMEYFKNSQARDAEGRLARVFHTTNRGGFTIFDPSYSDDKRSLFFASNWDVSQTYGYNANREINLNPPNRIYANWAEVEKDIKDRFPQWLEVDDEDGMYNINVADALNAWVYRKEDNSYADDLGQDEAFDNWIKKVENGEDVSAYYVTMDVPDPESYEGAIHIKADNAYDLFKKLAEATTTGGKQQRGYYSCYLNLENPLIVDAHGANWNNIPYGKQTWNPTRERTLNKMESEAEAIIDNVHIEWDSFDDDFYGGDYRELHFELTGKYRQEDGSFDDWSVMETFDVSADEVEELGDRPGAILGQKLINYWTDTLRLSDTYFYDIEEYVDDFGMYIDYTPAILNQEKAPDYITSDGYKMDYAEIFDELAEEDDFLFDPYEGTDVPKYKTRELAQMAQTEGYDGVIIRNCRDLGGVSSFKGDSSISDIFIAFSSNQVKDINNENPTENPDIRYSIPDEDETMNVAQDKAKTTDDVWATDPVAQEGRIRKKNGKQDFINGVTNKWNPAWKTEGKVLKDSSVEKAVRDVIMGAMRESNTTAKYRQSMVKKTMLIARQAFNMMKNDEYAKAAELLYDHAYDMIENLEFFGNDDKSEFERYKELREYLRTTKITVPEDKRSDIDYAAFRKKNFGKILLGDGGTAPDVAWQRLNELWPEAFTEDIKGDPASIMLQMENALDIYEPYATAYSSEQCVEFAGDIADSLYDIIYEGEEYKSLADKYTDKTKAMKARHAEAMEKVKQNYKDRLNKQRLDAKRKEYARLEAQKERITNKYEERLSNVKDKYERKIRAQKRKADFEIATLKQNREYNIQRLKAEKARAVKEERQRGTYKRAESLAKQREKQMHRQLYNRVLKEYNDLTHRLLHPTKDKAKNIPEQLRQPLAQMLHCFDLEKERSKKLEEMYMIPTRSQLNFRELKDAFEKVIKEDPTAYELSDVHKYMADKMTELADRVDGKSIDALDIEDIKVVKDLLVGLNAGIKNAQQLEIDGENYQKQQMCDKVGEGAAEHQKLYGKAKKYGSNDQPGIRAYADHIINMGELTPIYFFRQIKGMYDMYRQMRKGFNTYVRNEKKIIDKIADILSDYYKTNRKNERIQGSEIEEWRHSESAETFPLMIGNQTITLTIAQKMSLYCLAKRSQAQMHMYSENGGIVASETSAGSRMHQAEERYKGKTIEYKPVYLTPADVDAIISTLTEDQKTIADQLQKLMSTDMAELGNEASVKLTGIEMYKEQDYFPIKVMGESLPTNPENIGIREKIRNPGFSNPLQENASNPIIVDDIFAVVASHCNEMNQYASYAVPITNFMKVYNGSVINEEGKAVKIKTVLKETYGEKALTYIENFIDDINGNSFKRHGGIDDVLDKVLGQAKKAAVFANLRVALQQPTAIIRALAVMNPKYFMGVHPSTKATKEMIEHCPIAQWKALGYFDTHFGRDIEDVMMGRDVSSKAEQLMSDIYGQLDNMTWGMIWQAVKNEVKATHKGIDETSQEFWDLCEERASFVFDSTQVVDSPFHRSNDMRSKDRFVKQLTSFQAEPTLSFNVLRQGFVDAYEALKKGDSKKARRIVERVLGVWVAQALTVALAQSIVDALRRKGHKKKDDEEDEMLTWYQEFVKYFFRNFGNNFKDDLNPINNIYFVKDIVPPIMNAIKGEYVYGTQSLTTQWVDTLTNGISMCKKKWEKGDADSHTWYDCLTELFGGLGYLKGIPAKTMMRGTKNAFHWAGKIFGINVFADDGKAVDKAVDTFVDKFRGDESEGEGGGLFDSIANKMGYRKSDESSGDTEESKADSADIDAKLKDYEESLSDTYTDKQKKSLVKQYKKTLEKEAVTEAAMSEDFDVQAHIAEAQANFDYEMEKRSIKAAEMAAGKTGRQRDEALWDVIADGYTKSVESGNMATIQRMREEFAKQGGDTEWFDAKIADKMKSAYKKTIYSSDEIVPGASLRQETMYNFMTEHGVSEKEISDIVYHSYTARDLKAAMRIGNEDYILDELVPMVAAGLSREDYEKLYKYRNMGAKTYDGKYTDPKYTKTTGTFIWPTDGVITSHFGYRNSPTAGASSNHPAIDIGAPMGTTVVAADGGTVIYAGSNGGYGNSVGVKHANGMVTYYNHLSAWNVKVGDQVAQGQPIANVGSTGISTGPHLDFKILDADGNPVDPEKYLNKRS